jgi:O-antigen/teichoic acid export membrane protein
MIKRLEKLYRENPRFKQVSSLFTVNLLIIPLSIISNIFITRYLGPVAFGDFKFIFSVFGFAMVLFNFGFLQAGNRALVLNSDKEKTRELYGTMLLVIGGIFLLYAIILVIYAFVDHNISEKGLRSILLLVIPFSWIFLLMNYFEVLFQADNKINLLAKSRLYPKIFFFIAVLLLYLGYRNAERDKLLIIWILFLSTHIATYLYIVSRVRPSFKNVRERIVEIWNHNKTYGFNVYIGTLFNVALASLSGLLIGYFGINNAGVGYFSLALTISEPLNFIPNVIATTHYKDFSSKKKIEKKLTVITVAASCLTLLLCWILVGPFIRIFYGPEFRPVIFLTIIASSGIILNGLADYFNRFLGAHGRGKALRNSAIIVGFVLLICNFTLIPLFDAKGAAYTRVLSGLVYFLNMVWYYRKLVKELASMPDGEISYNK